MLDRYGFGDVSSLAERVVFFTRPDDEGWVRLLPVQRRVDYADGSAVAGWLHPAGAVTDDQDCPCGSAEPYSACHGATIPAGDPFDRIRVYDADNHLFFPGAGPSAPVGYEQAQHVDRESSRLPQPVTSGARYRAAKIIRTPARRNPACPPDPSSQG
jgi:hypothetical protein